MKRSFVIAAVAALFMAVAAPAVAKGGPPPGLPGGDRAEPVIFVESQGLFYESIVGPALPAGKGPFQELYMGENGLTTDYGPGDPGYVGGRWWIDDNGNGEMDPTDTYFSCPLIGKGHASPPS